MFEKTIIPIIRNTSNKKLNINQSSVDWANIKSDLIVLPNKLIDLEITINNVNMILNYKKT